jgi:hypothetical protein
MAYTGDRQNQNCRKCQKRVKLVKCSGCQGKGGGTFTQCSVCNNSGYVCENAHGDKYHRV